jgi:type I restriction enzyme M protein
MDTIALYKHRIDALMDILFGAGVSNPQTIIEQLNYLLFLRALSIKDDEAELLGITDESEKIFSGDLTKYKWQSLLALNPEDLFKTVEEAFEVIQKKSNNDTVKLLFRNAHVKIFDKPTLRRVVHEIESFAKELDSIAHEGNKDVFGDMYEYLLSKLSSAGTNGQFRTPRHIIDFMVKAVAPKKNELILDPACGTAGFLVAAYRYLAEEYTSERMQKAGSPRAMDKLSSEEKTFLFNHMFSGFDSDEDMIKFGMMNLHLHGLTRSQLKRQNSLTETSGWNEKFDVILANPPFSGKIDEESVSEDLRMGTKATELLFLRFMVEHLSAKGRMAVVVPEGVVSNNSKSHLKIREMLIENGLWCVISLPAGVFNPYSAVKTNILLLDKDLGRKSDEVLFIRTLNDGFDLGAQRRPRPDLPNDLFGEGGALDVMEAQINRIKNGGDNPLIPEGSIFAWNVKKETILNSYNYNLLGNRYQEDFSVANIKWPSIELNEIIDINFGTRITKRGQEGTRYPVYGGGGESFRTDSFNRVDEIVISRFAMSDQCVRYVSGKFFLLDSGFTFSIKKNPDIEVRKEYLDKYLLSIQQKIYSCARGQAQKNLDVKEFKKIKIPIPSLKIQQEVVTEIDSKQDAINHAKAIIKSLERERRYLGRLLKRLNQSNQIELGEVCNLEYGYTDKAKDTGEARFVRITDIDDTGKLKQTDQKFIALDNDSRKFLLSKGDVLVARTGATYGKTVVFNENYPAIFASYLIRLSFDTGKILPEFYWLFTQSQEYLEQAERLMGGGAQPQFNANVIKKIKIPLIPLKIQRDLIKQAEKDQKIIDANNQLIDSMGVRIEEILKNT